MHDPAPADVWPRPAAVVQDVHVLTPSVLERVGQNRQPVGHPLLVNACGQPQDILFRFYLG
jgi:hypothetical protein